MSDRIILLRLFGVSLLWGCNYVASAYLLQEFSPIFLSFSRLITTSVLLLIIAAIGKRLRKPSIKEFSLLLIAGFFGTLLNQFFYFEGLGGSTAGNAALIIALTPIATTFLARAFLGEAITLIKISGAFLALLGVSFIVIFSGKTFGLSQGDTYLLIAMLALSISLLFTRKLTASMASYDITIYSTVFGTILMTPAALIEVVQGNLHFSQHLLFWLILAGAAIFGQGLAGFWWNQGISIVGASTSSMFMNIPPFVAILVAYLVLGDPIRAAQLAGGIMIITGVAVSNRKASRRVSLTG